MAARKLGIMRRSLRPALSLLSHNLWRPKPSPTPLRQSAASRKSTSVTRTSRAITLRLGR
jgi:hypothetical protein